ncbi:MAG: arsenate reductase ArsC [Thermoplasmata archaeon]|nr:arsenate reductase ArsC [Thermoplasmata archaeon]
MTTAAPLRILVVCTGNSARSILGEALLRHHGGDRVRAFSAGTVPKGINPLTLRTLAEAGLPADGYRSKPVTELAGERFDYVITVCDDARDACPVIPGARRTLHWSLPDPAAATGTEEERLVSFRQVLATLDERIRGFLPGALDAAADDPAEENG